MPRENRCQERIDAKRFILRGRREMLYFSIQNRVQGRTSKVSEAAGARCDFLIGLSSDCRRIVFLLAEAIHGVSAEVLNLQISWQAQYLVRLEGDSGCSAHCK